MKKILTSLIIIGGIIGSANAADINPGVQDVLNTENQEQALNSLNQAWYDFGTLYPTPADLFTAFGNQTLDITKVSDTINHLIALDNYESVSINNLNNGLTLTNGRIDALDNKVNDLQKNLSAGVASATALSAVAVANVEKGEISVGGGYGSFNGENAAAFGAVVGIANGFSVNAGVGLNSYESTFRAGANYKFKAF
ncbi:MAG: YadA C-terminal domain-containing protein [Rickettsiales bacterium]|jgi:autotransporter adhesin|nr:YadA C-terminal domain-containing protein [Rickettsiales bacterium]